MEFGSQTDPDLSPVLAAEGAFEQLLRLAVSCRPPSLSARTDSPQSSQNPIAENIQLRAYHIFLERGAAHGHDLDDWLEAERQVLDGLKRGRASLRLALAFGKLNDSPGK